MQEVWKVSTIVEKTIAVKGLTFFCCNDTRRVSGVIRALEMSGYFTFEIWLQRKLRNNQLATDCPNKVFTCTDTWYQMSLNFRNLNYTRNSPSLALSLLPVRLFASSHISRHKKVPIYFFFYPFLLGLGRDKVSFI